MKWWQWLICVVLIIAGTFCAIDTVKYFLAGSKTYGDYKYVPNYYSSFYKENLVAMALTDEDGDGYYTYTKKTDVKDFDGLSHDYTLLVNEVCCYTTDVKAGAISGVFKVDLKNIDNEVTSSFEVNISIAFYESGTTIIVGIDDINNSLLAFEEYVSNNGFIVEIVEVTNE